MKPIFKRGLTLIELIISVILLGVVVMGFFGLDTFTREQLIATERREQIQNEAYLILSHMSKQLTQAIGDVQNPPVGISSVGLNTSEFAVYTDSSGDGILNTAVDNHIKYCYNYNGCGCAYGTYTFAFTPRDNPAPSVAGEVLSNRVRYFNATLLFNNMVLINLSTCWDPANITTCGTPKNPAVNLTSIVKMPLVSLQ
jgi:prepilin-type N-terminal cleavage/methylation domain-containing protein